jgi:hypothetical protein
MIKPTLVMTKGINFEVRSCLFRDQTLWIRGEPALDKSNDPVAVSGIKTAGQRQ